MPDGDKEYALKVFQAWLDLKVKLAGFVLVANGAALATAIAFVKDKGPELEGVFTLKTSAFGLLFGGIALLIVRTFADGYFARNFERVTPPVKPKLPPGWRAAFSAKWDRKFSTMAFTNKSFNFFILCSAACLLFSISYLAGIIDGRLSLIAGHPEAEKLLRK